MSVQHCIKYSPEYGGQGDILFQALMSQLGHLELHGCWSHLKAWLIVSVQVEKNNKENPRLFPEPVASIEESICALMNRLNQPLVCL